jgi:hypothetical protein
MQTTETMQHAIPMFQGQHVIIPEEDTTTAWTQDQIIKLIEFTKTKRPDWNYVAKAVGGKSAQDAKSWYEFVRVLHKHDWEKVKSPEESLESSGSESPKQNPSDKSMPIDDEMSSDDEDDEEKRKRRYRRKATQIERLYKCQEKNCNRSYGTEGALKMHLKLKHAGVRYNSSYQMKARQHSSLPQEETSIAPTTPTATPVLTVPIPQPITQATSQASLPTFQNYIFPHNYVKLGQQPMPAVYAIPDVKSQGAMMQIPTYAPTMISFPPTQMTRPASFVEYLPQPPPAKRAKLDDSGDKTSEVAKALLDITQGNGDAAKGESMTTLPKIQDLLSAGPQSHPQLIMAGNMPAAMHKDGMVDMSKLPQHPSYLPSFGAHPYLMYQVPNMEIYRQVENQK